MKRRSFLNRCLVTSGGVIIGKNILYAEAIKELNHQFSNEIDFESFDVIINGAGLAGYYAAIEASKKGMKVLVLDKRTSPGYDIAGKRKLWLNSSGLEYFQKEHFELFFPDGEKSEMASSYENPSFLSSNSFTEDEELLLFAGSIKKGMMRNLLINKVQVLLMTDVCGIISDNSSIKGVLVACKHGLFTIKCKSFIDATDNNFFTRDFFNQNYKIERAGFVIELIDVRNPIKGELPVDISFGTLNSKIKLHKSKKTADQQFIEFEFPTGNNNIGEIEQQARFISANISKHIRSIDDTFSAPAKLYNYALECSYFIDISELPDINFNGYYCFENPSKETLSCKNILDIESTSKSLIDSVRPTTVNSSDKFLKLIGIKETLKLNTEEKSITENGLKLPLSAYKLYEKINTHEETCQVLIAGGGTAGAMAAMGAAENGSNTLVIEYFNDLGGTKTMGGVLGYYLGLEDHPFILVQGKFVSKTADEFNLANAVAMRFHLLKTLTDYGCQLKLGTILCGVKKENNKITGLIISENGKLISLKSDITVDSTGDADIAYFAGLEFEYGNSRTGFTQNYSQWDISGNTKVHWSLGGVNRDYDIIDNSKISELQRGLFLSHYESHYYDFYPMLTVRESRRPKGVYSINVKDALEGTQFDDVISRTRSDFDPHYIGSSELSRCGLLLPHTNVSVVQIPYKAIVPEKIDGLLFSGRGISQTHNALQFTRMSKDVKMLGYVTGRIASEISSNKIPVNRYDVSNLQKELKSTGFLPPLKQEPNDETVQSKVLKLIKGEKNYLLKCCLLPKPKVVPVLLKEFNPTGNLNLAKALAWFSEPIGISLIIAELEQLINEENNTENRESFIDKYNPESLYWRINQNIGFLAMSGDTSSKETILRILNNTVSGGGPVTYIADNLYNSQRIDLRLIPYHNRITNICFYIERIPDPIFINGLERLLDDENIKGFKTTEYHKTRWRVYGADLELYLAAVLARCGAKSGFNLLIDYLDEIHSDLRGYAERMLQDITNKDFGYNKAKWFDYINSLRFPISVKKLVKKIEM